MQDVRRDERGFAMATVMGLLAIVLALALATLSVTDGQTRQSGVVRTKETAFNIAEAALNAQIFALAQEWPGLGDKDTPYAPCSPASGTSRCPRTPALTGLSSSPDVARGISWTTAVKDNGTGTSQNFYADAITLNAPGYDANGDGRLWVRSQATVNGRTRTLVALVRAEEAQEDIPHAALITGRLDLSNMGNKVIIDGSEGNMPTAMVRCTPQAGEAQPCLGHQIGSGGIKDMDDLDKKLEQQLNPNRYVTNYQGGDAMTPEARERLKARAIADGTYFTTCPGTPPSGQVVWIASGSCFWTGNQTVNSEAAPGMLVLDGNATLYLGGTVTFHGVVYAVNPTDSTNVVVQVQGNAQVLGGLLVDGPAAVIGGSSKLNVQLDDSAFGRVRSYVSAGIIQNTWREIRTSTGT